MKAKTLLEILNLSSNLYVIAKDKELFDKVAAFADKGKEKLNEIKEEWFDGESENQFVDKLITKMQDARQELETKIEEIALKTYKKMHLASTNQIEELNQKIAQLEKQLSLAEARIANIENPLKKG